jgi:hypothetical protein
MANNNRTQRINRHKVRNRPLPRQRRRPRNHDARAQKTEYEYEFKTFKKSGQFFKEKGVFCFFCGGSPGHVDFEEVVEEGLRDVE